MTEAEWLMCNEPEAMLEFCQGRAFNARKNRLFAGACCRLIWNALSEWDRNAVDVSERYADKKASDDEFKAIMFYALRGYLDPVGWVVAQARTIGAWLDTRRLIEHFVNLYSPSALEVGLDVAVKLVRDIFGNPCRPASVKPTWLTSDVLALAGQMYESRDFSPMPILADALMDSGCDNEDILSHCRQPGEHVRGCWVVDLILGKS
ncbi:hypothetical protein [Frigoriglobus tundricola]|uniref:SMI1/KNR4 family protein n=1 Tax=Frigoriglobus tundricola TaxID=2774151 RepID=A0A6M5YWJ8_9BACT|nr:hypothetical protein [Frigoriglobus tundricola]QJW97302.1 hypothetical protein FTUN_4872 [Frigoriglobus tundricola]